MIKHLFNHKIPGSDRIKEGISSMNKKQKKMLWRIIVSAVLMVALHFVPVTGLVRFALYMVPYFIVEGCSGHLEPSGLR